MFYSMTFFKPILARHQTLAEVTMTMVHQTVVNITMVPHPTEITIPRHQTWTTIPRHQTEITILPQP